MVLNGYLLAFGAALARKVQTSCRKSLVLTKLKAFKSEICGSDLAQPQGCPKSPS